MWKKVRDFNCFMLAILIFYGLLFFHGYTCPIKALTGISCPSCGMTRAYMYLLRLNPKMAFFYHPLFPIPAIFLIAYIFRNRLSDKTKKIGMILVIFLFFLVYLVRMADPNDTIVVCKPKESVIYKAYKNLVKN